MTTVTTEWTNVDVAMTLTDLKHNQELCVPGMLVEFSDGKTEGTILLIGHVNDLLGQCDDCALDRQTSSEMLVVRYRRVWVP